MGNNLKKVKEHKVVLLRIKQIQSYIISMELFECQATLMPRCYKLL